ncbi:MAG: TrkH family potassium uptake protein [Clostridia bacterium]|nr:TrkH family potassium uptake protein [Clostridia bacterium]
MAQQASHKNDLIALVRSLGFLCFMLTLIILAPLVLLLVWPEEAHEAPAFLIPAAATFATGALLLFLSRGRHALVLRKHASSMILLLLWIIAVAFCSIPFQLVGYTRPQAVFEAMSGLTTTGLTVTDVTAVSHLVLLYRSLLHLIGGVGLVLVLTAILANYYGMQLFTAEGHTDRLSTSPFRSARTILSLYGGFIVAGIILYCISGMPLFDAVNYAISAVATGGFAIHPDSIGHYQSVPIDLITMVLMLLGATNFMASSLFFRGKWKDYFSHIEVRCVAVLLAITGPIGAVQLVVDHVSPSILLAIDHSFFQMISILTTTGLSNVNDYLHVAGFALVPAIVLMFVGGNTDSTAGGLKAFRFALGAKSLYWDFRDSLRSEHTISPRKIRRFGVDRTVSRDEISRNYAYIIAYFAIACFGAFLLMLCGYSVQDSFLEFVSALGTVGLSVGVTSASASAPTLWILIVGMLIARLEIFVFLFGLARLVGNVRDLKNHRHMRRKEHIRAARQKKEEPDG